MIHILLLVLKIIGIILLVILLAAIAVIMAVLFVPVRYNLTAEYYDNKPDVKFNVSWLLHLFRINGLYNKNDGFMMKVKILFFTLYPKNKKTDADDNAVKKSHEKKTEKKEQTEHKRHEKNVFDDMPDKDELQDKQEGPCQQDVSVDELKKPENVSQKMIEKKDSHSETCKKTGIMQKIPDVFDKIKSIAVKIKITFKNIKNKQENLSDKIRNFNSKITDENNRKLVGFLWEQTKLVIAKVKPSKFKGHIRFGFDEPDITGRAAMYAAVLYGFLGLDFDLIPDFENEILEGEVYLKGSVQLFGIVIIALRVYTNELFKKIILKKN